MRSPIAFIDVDGLKAINGNQGHPAGDALLKRVGARLAQTCVPQERAYRFAGDEYAFLSPVSLLDELDQRLAAVSSDEAPFS